MLVTACPQRMIFTLQFLGHRVCKFSLYLNKEGFPTLYRACDPGLFYKAETGLMSTCFVLRRLVVWWWEGQVIREVCMVWGS